MKNFFEITLICVLWQLNEVAEIKEYKTISNSAFHRMLLITYQVFH